MKLADKIKYALINSSGNNSDLLVPNFFLNTYYEMDVFKLTKSGLITEFEIKISRSDFKNDFKKGISDRMNRLGVNSKHDELVLGKRLCNYFYFVVPENLISKDEVPKYCGLLYFNKFGGFNTIRMAKRLHKNKFLDFKLLSDKLIGRCNHLQILRNWNDKEIKRLKAENKNYVDLLLKNKIEVEEC